MIIINAGISSDDDGRLISLISLSTSSSNRGSVSMAVCSSTGDKRGVLSVTSSFGKTTGLAVSLVGGIESHELRKGVSITSSVGSFVNSGLVIISTTYVSRNYMSRLLVSNSGDAKNSDSEMMSLSVGGSISVLVGFGNGGVSEYIAINADVSFDDDGELVNLILWSISWSNRGNVSINFGSSTRGSWEALRLTYSSGTMMEGSSLLVVGVWSYKIGGGVDIASSVEKFTHLRFVIILSVDTGKSDVSELLTLSSGNE